MPKAERMSKFVTHRARPDGAITDAPGGYRGLRGSKLDVASISTHDGGATAIVSHRPLHGQPSRLPFPRLCAHLYAGHRETLIRPARKRLGEHRCHEIETRVGDRRFHIIHRADVDHRRLHPASQWLEVRRFEPVSHQESIEAE